ncbi:MAG: LamG domain-containing protein, partial [Phycisphaerales bacterium]|nr:LamG domain-containing protein [Phycisphaerales bacterium]
DFGVDRPIETYRVATEVHRNSDGTASGITIGEALTKILEIPFETKSRTGSTDPVNFPDGVQVLTRVRDVETDPVVDPDGFWVVFGTSPQAGDGTIDFQDITLNATQSISMVYTEDRDDDGVFKREEFMYLTSDMNPDTDGDSLGDYFEIREGWDIQVAGQNPKHVFPDPTRPNADQDLLDDDAEFAAGTHPKDPDTDSDGLLDGVDRCPLDPVNLPPTIVLGTSTDISGSEVTLTGGVYERLSDPGRCDVDAIDTIVIDWGDDNPFTPQYDPNTDTILGMGASDVSVSIQHIYATQNVSMITVTATDVRGEQSTAAFPVTITFPTAGLLAYYPMNDAIGVNNVINDAGPDDRDGSRTSPFAFDTNNRFGGASGAMCLAQDQVQNNGDAAAGVSLPPIPAPGVDHGFTIAAWLIADGSPSGVLVGQPGFTALFVDQGRYGFTIRDAGGTYHTIFDPTNPPTQTADQITCGMPAELDKWTFYAATVIPEGPDTRVRLYRGDGANWGVPMMSTVGAPVAETLISNALMTNPNPATNWRIVGNHNAFGPVQEAQGSGGAPFEGRIDDVRVYDRALVEIELNALFNEADNSGLPGN